MLTMGMGNQWLAGMDIVVVVFAHAIGVRIIFHIQHFGTRVAIATCPQSETFWLKRCKCSVPTSNSDQRRENVLNE